MDLVSIRVLDKVSSTKTGFDSPPIFLVPEVWVIFTESILGVFSREMYRMLHAICTAYACSLTQGEVMAHSSLALPTIFFVVTSAEFTS